MYLYDAAPTNEMMHFSKNNTFWNEATRTHTHTTQKVYASPKVSVEWVLYLRMVFIFEGGRCCVQAGIIYNVRTLNLCVCVHIQKWTFIMWPMRYFIASLFVHMKSAWIFNHNYCYYYNWLMRKVCSLEENQI